MKILWFVLICMLTPSSAQEVKVVPFEKMEQIMQTESNKLRVYNFWATWCRPCIIEMPYFEEMANANKENVEMIFVSLDYADEVETKVEPFLKKKNIKSPVFLVDNIDYNSWIDKVDPRWSGALPATVFVTPQGKKYFYEKEFKKEELKELVNKLINQ